MAFSANVAVSGKITQFSNWVGVGLLPQGQPWESAVCVRLNAVYENFANCLKTGNWNNINKKSF